MAGTKAGARRGRDGARRGHDEVPPARVRRRARVGTGLVIGGYLLAEGLLVLCSRREWLSLGVALPLSMLCTGALVSVVVLGVQFGPATFTRGRLTVRTLTGPRTIDLGSLRTVRLLEVPGRGSARGLDTLFVTDGRRVRAGLRSADAVAAVRRSIGRSTRVSRHARWFLKPPRPAWWRTVVGIFDILMPIIVPALLWFLLATVPVAVSRP